MKALNGGADQAAATVRLNLDGKYKDEQSLAHSLPLLLLGLGAVGSLFTGVRGLVLGHSVTNAVVSIAVAGLLGAGIWLLARQRVKVKVTRKGVTYEVGPIFHRKQKLRWADVDSCDIVQTPPLGQWSGQNIHLSQETVISMVGRNGLAIVMKDGQRYFIGCKDIDRLKEVFEPHAGPPEGQV